MAKRKSTTRRRKARTQPSVTESAIPNQIFLGLPWKTVRPKYERIVAKLKKRFPLSFVIVGREDNQDAEDLLEIIKARILTSSYAVFDATGGNANVSLEFGFADAHDVPRALYVSSHKASKPPSKESPIIADLAGKKQNRYSQSSGLESLLRALCRNHAYTKRYERFLSTKFKRRSSGQKRRLRSLSLKIVHCLAGDGKARRADVVQTLQADVSRYTREEIDDLILRMHNDGLITSVQGPYSTVTVT